MRKRVTVKTETWGNVPSDICAQRRLKSDCASAQSDLSLRCPHKEILGPWLSRMHPVKILLRLRECAGWSESSLDAHVCLRFYGLINPSAVNLPNYTFTGQAAHVKSCVGEYRSRRSILSDQRCLILQWKQTTKAFKQWVRMHRLIGSLADHLWHDWYFLMFAPNICLLNRSSPDCTQGVYYSHKKSASSLITNDVIYQVVRMCTLSCVRAVAMQNIGRFPFVVTLTLLLLFPKPVLFLENLGFLRHLGCQQISQMQWKCKWERLEETYMH